MYTDVYFYDFYKHDLPSVECSDSEELWDEGDNEKDDMFHLQESPPPLPQDPAASSNCVVTWVVGFLLLLQARHYIPDSAMNALLKFLHVLFRVLGRSSPAISSLVSSIPSSVHSLGKTSRQSINFTKFVVCPKCHHLYKFDDCIIYRESIQDSKTCTFIRFPHHSQIKRRGECGHLLLKKVHFSSGRQILYPFKVFPYKTLSSSLQQLLLRQGFAEACRHWKLRSDFGQLMDIYDGRVWKEFQSVSGQPFLAGDFGFGVTINVDWFQPYKHTICSVGAIYLTVMNLPRSIRFKRENIILVGILPGPSEPKHDVNPYIQPLVEELCDLWTGVTMQVCTASGGTSSEVIRCALLCVACDLPAGRKLCGFLGHSAKLGCSRCLKKFSGSVGSMNYSGFDRSQWPMRTNTSHRSSVYRIMRSKNQQEQNNLESSEGCRYSSLLELPYFDAPRMLAIDPMHNVFLGSGKHMLQLWLNFGIIKSTHFAILRDAVDRIVVPSDVGRIPRKIVTGFSGFTADQLKNWITIYSIPALHGVLSTQHLECWRSFVLACRLLCRRKLSISDVSLLDCLLMKFCTQVESIYGQSAITPNMHMHGHLKNVVEDYGPVYSFWLFAYERYNGILGYQPNNNRAIEPQLMSRFLKDNLAYSFDFPSELSEEFSSLCSTMSNTHSVGSVRETLSIDVDCNTTVTFTSACARCVFDETDIYYVLALYKKLHNVVNCDVTINSIFLRYNSLLLRGRMYSCSRSSRTGSQYIALAEWDEDLFGPSPTPVVDCTHPDSKYRPVKIRHYIKVSVSLGENTSHFLLAAVQWYKPHLNKNMIGKPAQIWCRSAFEVGALHSFLPVQMLKCRCAYTVSTINAESVTVVVPLAE